MAFHKCWIINTVPGADSPFAPPAPVPNYALWLQDRYRAGIEKYDGRTTCSGVAQLVNAIVADVRLARTPLLLVGPYRWEAITLLKATAGENLDALIYLVD